MHADDDTGGLYPADAPKPPKQAEKKQKKHRKKKRQTSTAAIVSLVIFLLAVLAGSAMLYLYAQTEPYIGAFAPGTMLMGHPLAGMSAEDGAKLLAKLTDEPIAAWQCALTWGEETYTLTGEDVGLRVDVAATLDPLWQIGRDGGLIARYGAMLASRGAPTFAQPALVYDMDAADALLADISAAIDCAPTDATVDFLPGNSAPFRFTQEASGWAFDPAPVRAQIEEAILALEPLELALAPKEIEPAVYRAELENAAVLRARVTLALDGDEASAANAQLAAKALDGLRVSAGEALSFNEAVGRRTEEAGYVRAAEPAYGLNAYGVGGGVCQVATALYQAALLAELDVTQRHAAAYPVPYAEAGQEAAVSDQGLDLVIGNPTDSPLFLTARVYRSEGNTVAEVQLIGEALDGRNALATHAEELPAPEEPVYVRDSEGKYAAYTDERVPVGEARPGYAAAVERIKTLDGEEVSREIVSRDEYAPVPAVVYVGVQER